jgi:polyketide synthase PksN
MKPAQNTSPSCADILEANGWIEWVDNQTRLARLARLARLVNPEHFWKEISSVIETMAEAGYFLTQTCFRDWMQHRLADDVDSWFERRPYIIRHPDLADIPALLALEELSWIEPLRATEEELRRRIQSHRTGQFLLEMEGVLAGVIYSQRIAANAPLFDHTFRTVSALHIPEGKIVQALAVNSLPSLQQYALGDQLLEFLLQLATLNPAIEQVVGVTLCKLYRAEQGLTMAAYIRQRNQYGQPTDPILNFHHAHGAQIKGLVPNYRPPDRQNEGNGVLVMYDLQNRLGSSRPGSEQGEIAPQIDIPAVLEKTVRSLLGAERVAGYAPNRALREMGLDSLELLALRCELGHESQYSLLLLGFKGR